MKKNPTIFILCLISASRPTFILIRWNCFLEGLCKLYMHKQIFKSQIKKLIERKRPTNSMQASSRSPSCLQTTAGNTSNTRDPSPVSLAGQAGSSSRFTSFLHLLTWPDMIARLPKAVSSCRVKSEGVQKSSKKAWGARFSGYGFSSFFSPIYAN